MFKLLELNTYIAYSDEDVTEAFGHFVKLVENKPALVMPRNHYDYPALLKFNWESRDEISPVVIPFALFSKEVIAHAVCHPTPVNKTVSAEFDCNGNLVSTSVIDMTNGVPEYSFVSVPGIRSANKYAGEIHPLESNINIQHRMLDKAVVGDRCNPSNVSKRPVGLPWVSSTEETDITSRMAPTGPRTRVVFKGYHLAIENFSPIEFMSCYRDILAHLDSHLMHFMNDGCGGAEQPLRIILNCHSIALNKPVIIYTIGSGTNSMQCSSFLIDRIDDLTSTSDWLKTRGFTAEERFKFFPEFLFTVINVLNVFPSQLDGSTVISFVDGGRSVDEDGVKIKVDIYVNEEFKNSILFIGQLEAK